jgi:hypothetical protein
VRAHFFWVASLLRAQDTHGFDPARIAARERTLSLLEAYAERGRFPRNFARRDRMYPAFIDACGTDCAVAFLMMQTDHAELAARIHETMNLAYVSDLAREMGEDLEAWAEHAGITPAEAALIQPDYCPEAPNDCQYYSLGGGTLPDPDDCVLTDHEEGHACGVDLEGTCSNGECELEEEADGCMASGFGPTTGSMAPVLAALFLLALRRRRVAPK